MTYSVKHDKYGEFIFTVDGESLTQAQLEAYMKTYRTLAPMSEMRSKAEESGLTVRAAFTVGWIEGHTADEVSAMRPKVVRWLAEQIDAIYSVATQPDPKASEPQGNMRET